MERPGKNIKIHFTESIKYNGSRMVRSSNNLFEEFSVIDEFGNNYKIEVEGDDVSYIYINGEKYMTDKPIAVREKR